MARQEPEVPSNTLSYFFREALRRIWVAKRTSFVAVAMIAISLLIVGAFLLVAENLGRAAAQWQGKSRIVIYLDSAATPAETRAVDAFLAARPELARRRLVSREEALARFKSYFANLSEVVGQLEENPFPPSYEIEVDPRLVQSRGLAGNITALRAMAGVDQVQYDWEWLTRLRRLVNVINLIGLVAGGILGIAAAFTIANVIRLTMMLYREEIEIMRLVGATERMIRGPFLIEGLIQGTVGGIFSIVLLYSLYEIARRSLAPSSSILWSFLFLGFLPWQKIAALVAGGMFAGWVGSWLSVRERAD
jgi:cell division transport system permease protein